jgi:hypothetical protein
MQQQQGGAPPSGMPTGGVPMGGQPGVGGQNQTPQSLAEISEQASTIAQQIVALPDFDRKQQLKLLRQGNKELHSLVKAEMEKLRSSAASQGQQMLLQQGQQPQG